MNHRQMGVSNCNDHSSRSHTLLLCEVSSESLSPDDHTMYIHKHGHLTFVDLAGRALMMMQKKTTEVLYDVFGRKIGSKNYKHALEKT